MADRSNRAGGAPVSQYGPVVTDGISVVGNGTDQFPLRAPSVTPPSQIERLTTVGGLVTIDPDIELSIITSESPPTIINASLGAPTSNVDGYQKTVLFSYAPIIAAEYWRLLAAVQPGLGIGWGYDAGGGSAVLIWDSVGGFWRAASIYAGSAIFV